MDKSNVQERLEGQLESAQATFERGNKAAWFQLACVAVRALIMIASYLWDNHAEDMRSIAGSPFIPARPH